MRPKTVRDLVALLQGMDPDAYVLVNSDGPGAPPIPWSGSVEARDTGATRYEVPTVVLDGDMWRNDYPERVRDPAEGAFTWTITEVRDGVRNLDPFGIPRESVVAPVYGRPTRVERVDEDGILHVLVAPNQTGKTSSIYSNRLAPLQSVVASSSEEFATPRESFSFCVAREGQVTAEGNVFSREAISRMPETMANVEIREVDGKLEAWVVVPASAVLADGNRTATGRRMRTLLEAPPDPNATLDIVRPATNPDVQFYWDTNGEKP